MQGPSIWPFHCHGSVFKLNIKIAKTWTLFSNNVNTTIRKYSPRAFIEWSHLWILLDSSGFRCFLGPIKFVFGSERGQSFGKKINLGANPVEASEFFLGFICNCLSYFTTVKISFAPKKINVRHKKVCCELSIKVHIM